MSRGARKEISAVIAAMLVLSIGIGVAGIIGIVIACRKKKRYAKRLQFFYVVLMFSLIPLHYSKL